MRTRWAAGRGYDTMLLLTAALLAASGGETVPKALMGAYPHLLKSSAPNMSSGNDVAASVELAKRTKQTLIGTFIGVIGGLATIESFVTWLESGGDSFKKCFGVEMDEHDAHLMDDIDALVAMRETVSKEVFNAEKKLIESLRRD